MTLNNTPGAGLTKSQKTVEKMQDLTAKIEGVGGKIAGGLVMAKYAIDGLNSVRTLVNNLEENSYDTIQDLKKQAKGEAMRRAKEEIPTKQEIIDKLMGHSCDLEVIKAVKKSKTILDNILNKGKSTIESVLKRLEKLQEKMEKAGETITTITLLVGVFRTLVLVLEIVVVAAALALNFFSSLFAAAGVEKVINDVIKKAESFVLKYTTAIKAFTGQLLKILGVIMVLFNLIPKIITILTTLLNMVIGFIDLVASLFAEYIQGCIPGGDIITDNDDGTQTVNTDALDGFLDSNSLNGGGIGNTGNTGNNGLNNGFSKYGDYIHDSSEKQHRIYKPRIK
tara:strand:+ start:2267 stop:3280 length:1014 start_codon:yes stop_codon:yes gene_type:complete